MPVTSQHSVTQFELLAMTDAQNETRWVCSVGETFRWGSLQVETNMAALALDFALSTKGSK